MLVRRLALPIRVVFIFFLMLDYFVAVTIALKGTAWTERDEEELTPYKRASIVNR